MISFELVSDDQDVAMMSCDYDEAEIYLVQSDKDGHKDTILLTPQMARQTIAALQAFLAGPEPHKSDCALHSSPAYPIEPCNCRT